MGGSATNQGHARRKCAMYQCLWCTQPYEVTKCASIYYLEGKPLRFCKPHCLNAWYEKNKKPSITAFPVKQEETKPAEH